MPATRSSSQQRSRTHANEPYTAAIRATGRPKPNSIVPATAEVIVLSSDDENPRPRKVGSSSRSKRKRSKRRFSTGEILEIPSSDVDEGSTLSKAPANGSGSSASQREISKLKHVSPRNYRNFNFTTDGMGCLMQDATKLREMLSCDICTHFMHSPYLLLDCGHSYCERCLKGWFDETLTKYIRAHPTYNMNRDPLPPDFPKILQTLAPYIPLQLRTQLHAMFNTFRQQQPEYTCPSCRKEVAGKPVVNYAIKNMVSIVAGVLGESDTRSSTFGRGQQMSPFDGFFPR
ncbi:hypothetical protein DFH29DRAFT_891731 [Suillus ampliporus]|nr:hypothetical protein DFH29DRAFT_891731 [Suillus ampliporus]